MQNRWWLVVSLDISELGEWMFRTREQAVAFKKDLIKSGADSDNINLYYGKITLSLNS